MTGSSAGSGTGADFATVKYDSAGEEQWIRRYNGSGNGSDEVVSIILSSSGKIYVSGYSTGIGTGADITTISYDPSGQQQWVASFNGPGNGNDYAKSITTDSSGNIFVTGHSYGIGSSSDYTTVKYSTQGIQKWIQRYNGPDNDIDYGLSIISDKSGNVYVTGLSTKKLFRRQ
ncbi:MAG: SBBP repeat-containing protein [Ignavibacteria bacterium]|nr:SBBP repeat-containing protein [Ignavibacteria bacterium]